MKLKSLIKPCFAIFLIVILNSCSDDFLERPPQDTYSLDEFYSSDEQVQASTNGLYGRPWFNLHNKALYAIAEVGSGNSFSYSSDINSLRLLNITTTDPTLSDAWKSCFAVVAQSNALINLLPPRVGPEVDQGIIDNAIAEAHFMRALAYFYLVRLYGPVPIIENNADHVTDPQLNTNLVEDIYTFIENDLNYAIDFLVEKNRGSSYADNGHVSKGSAKSILAKVYLYQKKYDLARQLAKEVIDSGEFKLYGGTALPDKSYGDLFLAENDNNEESIVAWQWTLGNYNTGNYLNTMFAYSTVINNATYGGVFAPSQDLLNAFEPGDLRRKQTVMLPGDYYPNLPSANGSDFTVPEDINAQNSGAGIKKYVVGKTGETDSFRGSPNNTYIMRYADLFLIHAEAILAGGESTSDPEALGSYNTIRVRAGLQPVTSFTFDDLLHERRVEFAFEADYWFDLGRIPGAKAVEIVSQQNRGDQDNVEYAEPKASDFRLPYPSTELILNPKLGEDPVPYNFN
tara:strand:+ start:17956 stop:19497 length:1542 start_codon:yes stop_codon:yes gene_type:complete